MALGGAPNGICDPWARWFGAYLALASSFPFPFPSRWVAAARRDPPSRDPPHGFPAGYIWLVI